MIVKLTTLAAPVGLPLQVGFHGDLLQWLNWLKQSEKFYRHF